ncbi:ADP-ribose pyrophosphatase [Boudabousia tangfeifanii]|uniref:ADP-ribose pyrophosphatase n=1 Tax=Boudabousia tangfeifanii TaxID=1912795 RepID=A0A1D9MLX4_9ACTO|nr:NUDIX domain-containing protein [Boudabousia tangfeifanii]AOZ73307.1 ADP-ribose pyrophosphatase [Boudabousia tangfeifanii]
MATPDFILELREQIGHAQLWLPGVTAVVLRPADGTTAEALPDGPLNPAEWEVLVVRRADNGHWTPVTGIIDPGEEPAVAGARETLEETGIHALGQRLLSTEVVGPITYANGDETIYLDLAFSFLVTKQSEGVTPWPADGENTECHFVRADQLPPMNARFTRVVARALENPGQAAFNQK